MSYMGRAPVVQADFNYIYFVFAILTGLMAVLFNFSCNTANF